VIGDLVPAGVVTAEALDDSQDAVLLPEEEPVVAHAVEKRRREFATTRACARRALAALGLPPQPLLSGPRREPLWPEGIVGSLTHCAGYRAAAVARRSDFASLGIDAEPHDSLPEGVLSHAALPVERDTLGRLPAGVCWDRVLFSAKESIYKAWYPLAGDWLGFEDTLIDLRPDAGGDPTIGALAGRLLVPGPLLAGRKLSSFGGRYAVRSGLVLTAVSVSAEWAP
jgi:4'-phosphopantetheinyl transferase EntD